MSLRAHIKDGEILLVDARFASGNAPIDKCKVHIDNRGDGTCDVTWEKPGFRPRHARVRIQGYIVIPDTAEALAVASQEAAREIEILVGPDPEAPAQDSTAPPSTETR